jgi:hypothetical protein
VPRRPYGGITTFSAAGAGTGTYQGTVASDLNPTTAIAGYYVDASNVYNAILRTPGGHITPVNVPGAGTGAGQGSFGITVDPAGELIGTYIDASSVVPRLPAHAVSPCNIVTPTRFAP